MCVTIPILDDGPNENTESFSITFTQQTSSGPRVTVVSVFIIDNGGLKEAVDVLRPSHVGQHLAEDILITLKLCIHICW